MLKISVEAFADETRPRGGYAIILLRGLTSLPPQPSIRLKPVEAPGGGAQHRVWRGESIIPVATRLTEDGMQIVVGPEVVGNPHLLAGMPVLIEIPDADVRGEFVWPSVVPLASPRRRHMAAARRLRPPLTVVESGTTLARPETAAAGAGDEAGPAPRGAATGSETVPAPALNGFAHADDEPGTTGASPPSIISASLPRTEPVPAIIESIQMPALDVAAAGDAAAPLAPAVVPAAAMEAAGATGAFSAASGSTIEAGAAKPSLGVRWRPEAHTGRRMGAMVGIGAGLATLAAAVLVWVALPRAARPPEPSGSRQASAAAEGLGDRPASVAERARPSAGAGPAARPEPAGSTAGGMFGGMFGGTVGGGGTTAPGGGASPPQVAAPAAPAQPAPCRDADVSGEAMDSGFMRIRIASACRANQDVHIGYGGADLVRRLDASGTLAFALDCFAGTATPAEIRFEDGQRRALAIQTRDAERVSKVAIVWSAPVNLDLHAFEYAASIGQKGHVWAQMASSHAAARQEIDTEARGHGWLSTIGDGKASGDKLEVYTFLHGEETGEGMVSFAVDYESRGDKAAAAACGSGKLAEVGFHMTVLSRGGRLARERAVFAPAPCDRPIASEARYQALAAPVLKIAR